MSAEKIANTDNESWRNIYRYINLTNLIFSLLDKIDERKFAFIPAVELSYLTKDEQEWLYDILDREEHFGVPLAIATLLKGISKNGTLTFEKIDNIIVAKNKNHQRQLKYHTRHSKIIFLKEQHLRSTRKSLNKHLKNGLITILSIRKRIKTNQLGNHFQYCIVSGGWSN